MTLEFSSRTVLLGSVSLFKCKFDIWDPLLGTRDSVSYRAAAVNNSLLHLLLLFVKLSLSVGFMKAMRRGRMLSWIRSLKYRVGKPDNWEWGGYLERGEEGRRISFSRRMKPTSLPVGWRGGGGKALQSQKRRWGVNVGFSVPIAALWPLGYRKKFWLPCFCAAKPWRGGSCSARAQGNWGIHWWVMV